jgi:hypothetical protein
MLSIANHQLFAPLYLSSNSDRRPGKVAYTKA